PSDNVKGLSLPRLVTPRDGVPVRVAGTRCSAHPSVASRSSGRDEEEASMTHRTSARCLTAAVAAAALLLLPGNSGEARAQAARGGMPGNIADRSGAPVPGVLITITEIRTKLTQNPDTNDSGNYAFPNVRDGLSRVEAELAGFKKAVRENVQVDVNTTIRVDMRLEVGDLSESITVATEAPALQTDRADTGRIIPGKQVQDMP